MALIMYTRCERCMYEGCYDPARPHTWLGRGDAHHFGFPWPVTAEQAQAHPCQCTCGAGPDGRAPSFQIPFPGEPVAVPGPVNTVCVEFEGLVHTPAPEPLGGAPVQGAFDAIATLMSGMAVCVRTDHAPHDVLAWLRKHGFTWLITTGDVQEWKTKGSLLITDLQVPATLQLRAGAEPVDWPRNLRSINEIGIPGYNRRI